MPDSLAALEGERTKLLQQFLTLGDLRPGSVTVSMRRCGKPTCHCARHHDPGHLPQFRLSRKVDGKTVNESFPTPEAMRKAQREVAEFQRWQQLGQQLVALNEKICGLRPVTQTAEGWTTQEKKRLLHSIRKLHARSMPG